MQVLHRQVHTALFPVTVEGSGCRAAVHWALLSLSSLIASFIIANAAPFFADFQDLLGNLFGAPTVFGWPAFFYLRGKTLRGLSLSWIDRLACGTYLAVCVPAFTLLGTYQALVRIGEHWSALDRDGNGTVVPFQCG